jgi:thiamine transport system ATP-binding protein
MLELRNIAVDYAGQPIISNLSLAVATKEIVSLVGPSGSGKTTLLRVIAGLEKPRIGSILIDGSDVSAVPTHQRGIGLVFQDNQLFPHLTVEQNIAYPLRMRGQSKTDCQPQVEAMLQLIGLQQFGSRHVQHLSVGEAKRVAVARSLIAQPSVLLLDEPLTGLDTELHDRLLRDIAALLRARGTTVVHVTHDLREATTLSDRVVDIREIGAPCK